MKSLEVAQLQSELSALRESFARMLGTVAALDVVLLAVAETHRDTEGFSAKLQLGFEQMESHLIAQSRSERMITQFREARSRFQDAP